MPLPIAHTGHVGTLRLLSPGNPGHPREGGKRSVKCRLAFRKWSIRIPPGDPWRPACRHNRFGPWGRQSEIRKTNQTAARKPLPHQVRGSSSTRRLPQLFPISSASAASPGTRLWACPRCAASATSPTFSLRRTWRPGTWKELGRRRRAGTRLFRVADLPRLTAAARAASTCRSSGSNREIWPPASPNGSRPLPGRMAAYRRREARVRSRY